MSDYYIRESHEHLGHLENTFHGIGSRPLTDGSKNELKDISLSHAVSLLKESEPYTTGEFKIVDPDDFIPLFELVGLDMNQSLEQAFISLSAAHIKTFKTKEHKEYKAPDILKFAFRDAPSRFIPADVSDATQLLDHILRVVAETPACHQDFENTKLNIGTPEHILFLSLG